MWVKPLPRARVRDPNTMQLWPLDEATGETLHREVDDHDLAIHQLINHGGLVLCDENGAPLDEGREADAAEAKPEQSALTALTARVLKAGETSVKTKAEAGPDHG